MEDLISGLNNININKYSLTNIEKIDFLSKWIIQELQEVHSSYFNKERINILDQRMNIVENAWKQIIETEQINLMSPSESHIPIVKKIVYYIFNILLLRLSNLTYNILDDHIMYIIISDPQMMDSFSKTIYTQFEYDIIIVAETLFRN